MYRGKTTRVWDKCNWVCQKNSPRLFFLARALRLGTTRSVIRPGSTDGPIRCRHQLQDKHEAEQHGVYGSQRWTTLWFPCIFKFSCALEFSLSYALRWRRAAIRLDHVGWTKLPYHSIISANRTNSSGVASCLDFVPDPFPLFIPVREYNYGTIVEIKTLTKRLKLLVSSVLPNIVLIPDNWR